MSAWRVDRSVLVALLVLFAAGPAMAETVGFKIARDAGGKLSCDRDAAASAATPPDALIVKLTRPSDAAQQAVLSLDPGGGAPKQDFPGQGSPVGVEFKLEKAKIPSGATIVVRDPGDEGLKCPAVPIAGAAAKPGGAAEAQPVDTDAVQWWEDHAAQELDRLREKGGMPSGTLFLVHYASGESAAPFPTSASESTPIQVAVLAPEGGALTQALAVTSCAAIQPFRVRGQEGAPQSKARARNFVLVPVGPILRCGAGTLSYSLTVNGVSVDRSVRIRPVYRLSFTVAYGFDFTQVPSYSVQAGTVARTRDRAGLGLRLGLTWFPAGIDYEDMHAWNYVNPVIAFDPTAPTENFLVGAAISPTGGFAAVIGANFRRTSVLRGVKVGDPLTGADVPTDKQWNKHGIGLYVGISVDTDVYQVIKGRLGQ